MQAMRRTLCSWKVEHKELRVKLESGGNLRAVSPSWDMVQPAKDWQRLSWESAIISSHSLYWLQPHQSATNVECDQHCSHQQLRFHVTPEKVLTAGSGAGMARSPGAHSQWGKGIKYQTCPRRCSSLHSRLSARSQDNFKVRPASYQRSSL